MNADPIHVSLDQNDSDWTSQRYYVDNLVEQFTQSDKVRLVDEIETADIVHLNYLNPLSRLAHGKEDRWQHLSDVAHILRGLDAPVVATEHGVEEFSDVEDYRFRESRGQRLRESAKPSTWKHTAMETLDVYERLTTY